MKFSFCPLCGYKLITKFMPLDGEKRLVCSNCGFVFYQNPPPTVLAFVEKGNKVLLVKRAINPYKGYWDLPGGFVEIGQTIESALKQEIKEELGVEINTMSFISSFAAYYKIKHLKEEVINLIFKVTLTRENFKIGSDVTDAKWFLKTNLPKLVPQKAVKIAFEKLIQKE